MKPVALAADLDEVTVVHQTIEECGDRWRVAEELGPMCVTKGALNVK